MYGQPLKKEKYIISQLIGKNEITESREEWGAKKKT